MPDGASIFLRLKPSLRAESALKSIQTGKLESPELKAAVFNLRNQLKDPAFADEFIEQNGIHEILRVVEEGSGNLRSYALGTLREAMSYVSGMEAVCETEGVVKLLYFMMGEDTDGIHIFLLIFAAVGVARGGLELLFVIMSFLGEEGYQTIEKVAQEYAKKHNQAPFQVVISKLNDGDQNTKATFSQKNFQYFPAQRFNTLNRHS